MGQRGSKLERATVVAGFDTQSDAGEALLELRLAGVPDRRIGYYHPAADGRLTDQLARRYRFAAAVIGGIAGSALGALLAVGIAWMWYAQTLGPDLNGLMVTCGIFGAFLFGTAAGAAGLGGSSTDSPPPGGTPDPFVLAVEAGDAGETVRSILRRHGGHDRPASGATSTARDGTAGGRV